jgi:NADH-quinone oxidoreductase subunit H
MIKAIFSDMKLPFATLQAILILLKIVCLLVAIAYYTIAERKIMAAIQRRRGPNVVGFWGLLQPLADGLKLVAKEMVIPSHSNSRIFVIAPLVILTLGLVSWSIIPFGCYDMTENYNFSESLRRVTVTPGELMMLVAPSGAMRANLRRSEGAICATFRKTTHMLTILAPKEAFNFLELNDISDVNYGVLVILALSSLTVYGLIIAGWASNSKYAFLGALRSAAQMISYEVSISLVLLPVIALAGSLNFTKIVTAQEKTVWFVFPLLPAAIIFFISMIAETNRTPFDLPEAEAELVAGYNVEYSSIIFAMFFLGEYSNMILMSVLNVIFFFGGWSSIFNLPPAIVLSAKSLVFCFLFVLVRATFPRYRYDQLMDIGWKIFLPLATGYLMFAVGNLFTFDVAPVVQEISALPFSESAIMTNVPQEYIISKGITSFLLFRPVQRKASKSKKTVHRAVSSVIIVGDPLMMAAIFLAGVSTGATCALIFTFIL